MITTGELKKGVAIELDGELWQILDYHHIKMGRGSAQVRIKLRNIKRGQTVERSFQAGEKWPRASLEKRPVQFLYRDGDDFHFMDNDTLRAVRADRGAARRDRRSYLKDGMTLDRTSYQGETIGVELPITVELAVVETEPGLRRRHAERRPQAGHAPRPASSSRCRSSSSPATSSASTRGPGSTRPGSDGRWRRRPDCRWTRAADDPTTRPLGARPTVSASRTAWPRVHPSGRRGAIRDAVRRSPALADLWVEGEVGQVTVSSAGHCYFTLKDERAQLRCMIFRDDRLAIRLRAADRAPRRRPRPHRRVRAAGRVPAVRRSAPAGRPRRPRAALRGAQGAAGSRGPVRARPQAAAAAVAGRRSA